MANSMLAAVRDAVAGAVEPSSIENISNAPGGGLANTQPKDPSMSVNAEAHAAATVRIKSIMQAPEAKGRGDLAQHLAFNTAMDAGSAIAVMRAAPTSSAEAGGTEVDQYERERLNALSGLAMPFSPGAASTGIVAAMKRRHGANQER